MTYCLALRLDEGLVLVADTRTNAGLDDVSTYRKLHVFRPAPDRAFALESAGNLATTQEVLDRIARDLETGAAESLASVGHLFADVDLATAVKVALGSMMSTARANLSVGPPYDVAVLPRDGLDVQEYRVPAGSPLLGRLREVWERHVLAAVADLPSVSPDDLRPRAAADQVGESASPEPGSSAAAAF